MAEEEVLGGGAGGVEESRMSRREDWTSRAWLGFEQLLRLLVVDSERWAGPEPRPGLGRGLGLGGRRSPLAISSSASLLMPELHSSRTLSLSLCRAMSANSSKLHIFRNYIHPSVGWKDIKISLCIIIKLKLTIYTSFSVRAPL